VSITSLLEGVSEAANLPAALGPPNRAETPTDLHERLLVTRAAMTRVSELAGELTLLTGKVKAALVEARGSLEDAEGEIVTARRPAFTTEYNSAREKDARLGAGTLDHRRKVRQAEKLLAEVEAALYYSRDRHRELDRAVRDIDTRLRIITIEPSAS
jgi:hypothetical protein